MSISITTPNPPRPKPAHKVRRFKDKVISWNPSTQEKIALQNWMKNSLNIYEEIKDTDELHVHIVFYMPIPKHGSIKDRNFKEWGITPHITAPDCDNCSKFACDVANGVAWPDDKQITKLTLEKKYDLNPRVQYIITTKERMQMSEVTKAVLSHIGTLDMGCMFEMFSELLAYQEEFNRLGEMDEFEKKDFLEKLSKSFSILCKEYGRKMATIAKRIEE